MKALQTSDKFHIPIQICIYIIYAKRKWIESSKPYQIRASRHNPSSCDSKTHFLNFCSSNKLEMKAWIKIHISAIIDNLKHTDREKHKETSYKWNVHIRRRQNEPKRNIEQKKKIESKQDYRRQIFLSQNHNSKMRTQIKQIRTQKKKNRLKAVTWKTKIGRNRLCIKETNQALISQNINLNFFPNVRPAKKSNKLKYRGREATNLVPKP